MTDESRKLFQNGVQAASESRWEAARALFLAARALHPHYTIDGNVGDCELHLGRYREAAEYLARYVRELKKDTTSTAEERAQGEAAYAEARAKVGALVLHTNVDGARVFVDDTLQGVMPLPDPLFVEPGAHTISVEHEDYETKKTTVQLAAGGTIEHRMPMERRPAGTPAPKAPETTAAHPAARSWVPVIALGAASVVGLGVGVGLTVASNDAVAEKDDRKQGILREGGQCVEPSASFVDRCNRLRSAGSRADTLGNGARVAYIASGALAAAAVTYLLWPRDSAMASGTVLPAVRTDGAGITVIGAF
ncbi:PEGA domain-containing protein [Sorangium sp. So ce302]|uniref:PEGA domain-containing protein n=1 Tax=Sorangium sp. So ce302 TaxID=3133297 RepID=UPI003F5F31BB